MLKSVFKNITVTGFPTENVQNSYHTIANDMTIKSENSETRRFESREKEMIQITICKLN